MCRVEFDVSSLEIEWVSQGTPGISRGAALSLFDDAVGCAGAESRSPRRDHLIGLYNLLSELSSFRRQLKTSLATPAWLRKVVRIDAICLPGVESSLSVAAVICLDVNVSCDHVFQGAARQDRDPHSQPTLRLGHFSFEVRARVLPPRLPRADPGFAPAL